MPMRGDLRRLTGYQLIEVVNGPFENYDAWDTALSSGRAVWAMANDDTHDTDDPTRTGMAWNMIDAASTSSADIVAALRAGRAYAVGRKDDAPAEIDLRILGVEFAGDTLHVTTEGALSEMEFIGQQGTARRRVKDVLSASYTFEDRDTYVRTVIHTPRATVYLNPVFRYDGRALPAPAATVDVPWTWTLRVGSIAGLAVAVAFLGPRRRREPRPVSPRVVTNTDRETA